MCLLYSLVKYLMTFRVILRLERSVATRFICNLLPFKGEFGSFQVFLISIQVFQHVNEFMVVDLYFINTIKF
jgi:hypothetical protein